MDKNKSILENIEHDLNLKINSKLMIVQKPSSFVHNFESWGHNKEFLLKIEMGEYKYYDGINIEKIFNNPYNKAMEYILDSIPDIYKCDSDLLTTIYTYLQDNYNKYQHMSFDFNFDYNEDIIDLSKSIEYQYKQIKSNEDCCKYKITIKDNQEDITTTIKGKGLVKHKHLLKVMECMDITFEDLLEFDRECE